jgi:hypothetical protein
LPLGQLSDVGFGLRLGNARSGLGNVVHIDRAWALNAGPQARHFQISVQTQRSY